MIKSMTAFGRGRYEGEDKNITVEIKSVNSRFFDCSVKLPRSYIAFEEKIKSHIQKTAVSRAKVDVYITVENLTSLTGEVDVDIEFARSYVNALKRLCDELSVRDDISALGVAKHPDVLRYVKAEEDMEAEWEKLLTALDLAILDYVKMREGEGARIERDVSEKIELVRSYAAEVEAISKSDTVGYRDKLEARLRQILTDNSVTLDENRILTECAIWADKIAIDEELVRLRSHFDAFYEIAKSPECSGRKLDFLMQELNRETNTIGSKANNAKIARIVVNMKGELEKYASRYRTLNRKE